MFEQRPVDSVLYDELGLKTNCSQSDIKKAYRQLAMKYHPDKNPNDPNKFVKLQEAYEILSDPQKRKIYNSRGKKGVASSVDIPNPNMFDIFRQFGEQTQARAKDVQYRMTVGLKDLYNGCSRNVKISSRVACDECKGAGGTNVRSCENCQGHGIIRKKQEMGMGTFRIIQMKCQTCAGVGRAPIAEHSKCKKCKGEGIVVESHTHQVNIAPNLTNGSQIVLKGKALPPNPTVLPGDVVVVIIEKPDKDFTRKGTHLYTKVSIPLVHALVGGTISLKLINDSFIHFNSPGGIQSNTDICIEGRGMTSQGCLFVNIYIIIPTVNSQDMLKLQKILPGTTTYVPQDSILVTIKK
jgi:DnaJ-class molecular chaperone